VLMPICGVASAIMFIPTLMWLLDRTPSIGRSTAIAAFHTVGSLGFLLGPLCCGQLIALLPAGSDPATPNQSGYSLAFAVAGLAEIAGAIVVVVIVLRQRQKKTSPL